MEDLKVIENINLKLIIIDQYDNKTERMMPCTNLLFQFLVPIKCRAWLSI